jgi:hypothetical protein
MTLYAASSTRIHSTVSAGPFWFAHIVYQCLQFVTNASRRSTSTNCLLVYYTRAVIYKKILVVGCGGLDWDATPEQEVTIWLTTHTYCYYCLLTRT